MTEKDFTSELLKLKDRELTSDEEFRLCNELIPIGLKNNYIGFQGDIVCNSLIEILVTDDLIIRYLKSMYLTLLMGFNDKSQSKEKLIELVELIVTVINRYGSLTERRDTNSMLSALQKAAMKCGIIIAIN